MPWNSGTYQVKCDFKGLAFSHEAAYFCVCVCVCFVNTRDSINIITSLASGLHCWLDKLKESWKVKFEHLAPLMNKYDM